MKSKKGTKQPGRLYGIDHSNRASENFWSKNNFNSTFPAALACYMRDKGIPAVYLRLGDSLSVDVADLSLDNVFNTDKANSDLEFCFESKYKPYAQYAPEGESGSIDLIIKHYGDNSESAWRRALEVKLTVLPDSGTAKLPQSQWGSELVIRPITTRYCAFGMFHSCIDQRKEIRNIFKAACSDFESWNNIAELMAKREKLLAALNTFQEQFRGRQQPFLMQPIWKTVGQSSVLADQAFDLFVWSDFALCRTFIREAQDSEKITRFTRAAARLARMLYVLSTEDSAQKRLHADMAFGLLTDKEFSLSGRTTRVYMNSVRRERPILKKEVITEIILDGGEKALSPERRFDALVFFTAQATFEVRKAEAAKVADGVTQVAASNT
jgi:hypothetical protein